LAIDFDGDAFFRTAIDNSISLDAISVRRKRFVSPTEMDTRVFASADLIVANEIVRIGVAKGHSIIAIFNDILFVDAMLRAQQK